MRILFVEDHPLIQVQIGRILRDRLRRVQIVDHGNLVLQAAQQLQPDAVVMDVSLPGISGMQVLPHLRKQQPLAAIVMLSTHTSPVYQREAMARGADAYVMKAHAPACLLPALRQALSACHGLRHRMERTA